MGSNCGIRSTSRNQGRGKAGPGDGFPSSWAPPEHAGGVGKGMVRATRLVTNAENFKSRNKASIDQACVPSPSTTLANCVVPLPDLRAPLMMVSW